MASKMKKLIASILAATLTLSSVSYADPPQPTNDPGKVVAPLAQGQSAPFPGVLFSQSAAASVVTDFKSFDGKMAIEIVAAVKKAEALKDAKYNDLATDCKAAQEVRDAQIDAQKKTIKQLTDTVKSLQDSTPNRALWAGVGFVGGVFVTVVTVFAITQATK
jgi:hypothetical protein